jgi:hypothetical protein
LEERLSKLRAAGEPLSLAEFSTAPAPPGKNAADVLEGIKPELKALSHEINPVLAKATADNPRPDPFPEEDRKALEEAFANHPKVLPALNEAADCPSYHSPLNDRLLASEYEEHLLAWTLLVREAANAFDIQERLQLQRKDYDGAMRTCLASLRLTRVCGSEPMMISYLVTLATRGMGVRMANEILRAGPVAPELHKQLEAELVKHDTMDGFRRSLLTERAFGLQTMEEQLPGGWFTRAYVNDNKCQYLDLLAECIDRTNGSYSEMKEQERASIEEAKSMGFRRIKYPRCARQAH